MSQRFVWCWLLSTFAVGCSTMTMATIDSGSGTIDGGTESSDDSGVSSGGQPVDAGPMAGSDAVKVTCANTAGDAALLQTALNAAGPIVAIGTCNLGSTTLNLSANTQLFGSGINGNTTGHGANTQTVFNYTGSNYALATTASHILITGITFNGGGLHGTAPHSQGAWTVISNTFQDITSGNDGIHIDNILMLTDNVGNILSNNDFLKIWQTGYPNTPGNVSYSQCGSECLNGAGIFWNGGLDNTRINSNVFDKIGFNAIKGFMDELYSVTPGWAFTAHNIVVSNNIMTNVHRIGIEVQGIGHGGCVGGCNYNDVPSDGTVMSGNFWHAPAFMYNAFAYSALWGGTNAKYINNTGVVEDGTACYLGAGIGIEDGMQGGVTQGNVIGAVTLGCTGVAGNKGWAVYITDSYGKNTNTYANNTLCGAGEPTAIATNSTAATVVENHNFKAASCPNAASIATSAIAITATSADQQSFTGGGMGTWKVAVVSTLSLRNVEFFVDHAASSVVAPQELSDVSSTFDSDRAWQYHATFDTTSLGKGSHTITAIATDVSGATKSVSQSFTR